MACPVLSISTVGASRRIGTRVLATLLFVFVAPTVRAEEPKDHSTVLTVEAEPDERWRESGLAHVDLPLGIRARFEASYLRHLYSSDLLAQTYIGGFGPGIQRSHSVESRVALTRPIMQGIEFEIAWEVRNSLALSDPMGFGRQTIGARIRISP